jgi:hypothetical protein
MIQLEEVNYDIDAILCYNAGVYATGRWEKKTLHILTLSTHESR